MQIVCKKCGYSWDSHAIDKGAKRISCSHCKTSITIANKPIAAPTVRDVDKQSDEIVADKKAKDTNMTVIDSLSSKHQECFVPIPLADQLNKFLMARLIGMARSNGESRIRFKVNDQGELYVP